MAMTPYYSDDSVTIYHADNREVLPTLSDVGMVLTSPPYNLHRSGGTEWARLTAGYADHDDAMPSADYIAWQQDVLTLMWATLSDDGAIYYNHKPRIGGDRVLLPLNLVPDHMPIRQIITWDRGSGFCRNLTHYVPTYEWVLLIAKPAFRTNTRVVDDVWRVPFEIVGDHPAPFPLRLASLAVATTDAQLIVDPFMGSGTTLRAAKDLGRRAIGIELSEAYCEIAAKRMGQEVLDLFGAAS
jgi:site-specific DNA-methyltransferase (adenine-specific)